VITLAALNALPATEFVAALDGIFEHSPWVAARVEPARPFDSGQALLAAMRRAVDDAGIEAQLALIRAHPQLGARGRQRAALTAESSQEQRRAGLDACTDEEFARLQRLNAAYVDKFGFPFILAVRGHTPASILADVERRLAHDPDRERRTALEQIGLIAGYRLADRVSD